MNILWEKFVIRKKKNRVLLNTKHFYRLQFYFFLSYLIYLIFSPVDNRDSLIVSSGVSAGFIPVFLYFVMQIKEVVTRNIFFTSKRD